MSIAKKSKLKKVFKPRTTLIKRSQTRPSKTKNLIEMVGEENKPPYLVPSMESIRSIPKNGLKAISFFSGCGGSSLGYKMAGYEVLWANEFVPIAQAVYMENNRTTIMDPRDIRLIRPEDVLHFIGMKPGELDLLDGSPPCRSFTTIPKKNGSDWGKVTKYSDTEQRTDDLFFEFARMISGIRPKVFVAENVSGLVKGKSQGMFLEFLSVLKQTGYRVRAKLLDASYLGVPQRRQRLFFVGVREDLNLDPVFPKPFPYVYSVRDAIPWIADPDDGTHPVEQDTYFINKDGSPSCLAKAWENTELGTSSKKYINLKRNHPDRAAFTVTASTGCAVPCHPYIPRAFSILELKRLCSFPDDFVLLEGYNKQAERLGRAVPPLMMKAIAETLRDQVFGRMS